MQTISELCHVSCLFLMHLIVEIYAQVIDSRASPSWEFKNRTVPAEKTRQHFPERLLEHQIWSLLA